MLNKKKVKNVIFAIFQPYKWSLSKIIHCGYFDGQEWSNKHILIIFEFFLL